MINIRPVAQDDHADWRRMWTAYLEFYETSVTEDVYDALWSRLLSNDPQEFNGLIAEVDGKPAGLTHYLFHRHGWKVENCCYLQDLYADPDVRGIGVGRALIEAVYAAADKEPGANGKVYWHTNQDNKRAQLLYDRIGELSDYIRYVRV